MSIVKLLCAEDNATLQKMVDLMLAATGVDIEFVNNGQAVLETLAVREFDLLLLDVEMPVLNGYQAALQIRQTEAKASKAPLPILFLTGHESQDILKSLSDIAQSAYLHKPFTSEQLIKAIDQVLWLNSASEATAQGLEGVLRALR